MKKTRLYLLKDKLFLLGLFVLLLNDFVLKQWLGGIVTGKLSDVAGLFIFPFFWSVVFFKRTKGVYVFTVLLFVFWKSPVSTPYLHWINYNFGTHFSRIVDYSDFVALLVVPVSYFYYSKKVASSFCEQNFQLAPILISCLSLFAFVATTLPTKVVASDVPVSESYTIDLPKQEIFERMNPGMVPDSITTMTDSLFFVRFYSGGNTLVAKVNVRAVEPNKTVIDLQKITSHTVVGKLFSGRNKNGISESKRPTADDYRKLFESGVVNLIRNKSDNAIFYYNARVDSVRFVK